MSVKLLGERHEIDEEDPRYPAVLREIPDHPKTLYILGDVRALDRPSVSIVGSRKATSYGLACAQMAAAIAARMRIQVVSSAAMGCDQVAQRRSLADGGPTLAVMGCGANVVYPPDAQDLLQGLVERGGAVVSLQPWDAPPKRWALARRNAVVAALSQALIICEAGMPSGTFSTARYAADFGKEVLVFPGSVFSPNSTGSNYIIASQPQSMPIWDETCLEIAFSRIYGVSRRPPRSYRPDDSPGEPTVGSRILASLQASPSLPGEIAAAFGLDASGVMRELADLELDGRVVRLRDGRYSLSEREFLAQKRYSL